MVEGFKLTVQKLKRILKISINLPVGYDLNKDGYPCVLTFDGQYLFDFLDEKTKKMDLNITASHSRSIIVGIHSPKIPDWRMSELNPYYNGDSKDVEPVLSIIYFDYIINELLPYLKRKYRISNDIYVLGFDEGAIAAAYLQYHYSIIKGMGLFNPNLNVVSNKFYEDIENKFDTSKKIYMYKGEKKEGEITDFYNFYIRLMAGHPEASKLDYVEDSKNDFSGYEKYLGSFLEFIEEK